MRHSWVILFLFAAGLSGQAQSNTSPLPAFEFLAKYPSVRDFTMSADGKEAYLTVQNLLEDVSAIVRITRTKDAWSEPQLIPFSGQYRDIEPFLSADGLRLYFSSNRPLNGTTGDAKDYDIWYAERKTPSGAWSSPVNLGAPVNTTYNEFYPSVTRNGNIYFTTDAPNSTGKDDIFFSKRGAAYAPPVPLGPNINSEGFEFNAYVAPDESFIIYTGYGRKDGSGSGDLYINFRDKDGNWDSPRNLGKAINSGYMDYCPFVDLGTGMLYFTSKRNTVTSKKFNSLKELDQEINKYENGLSRIYKVSVKDLLSGR